MLCQLLPRDSLSHDLLNQGFVDVMSAPQKKQKTECDSTGQEKGIQGPKLDSQNN